MQTLGRLNRPAPALGKATDLVQVVDFVNSVGSIRESFQVRSAFLKGKRRQVHDGVAYLTSHCGTSDEYKHVQS